MVIQDTRPRQHGSDDRGAQAQQQAHEHAAQEHVHSADIFEAHAVLLDRYGAHRSARTERRLAEDERDAAVAARLSPTPQPGRAHREVSLHR
jgi:hypothetical protein